jgi:hypothetical protein
VRYLCLLLLTIAGCQSSEWKPDPNTARTTTVSSEPVPTAGDLQNYVVGQLTQEKFERDWAKVNSEWVASGRTIGILDTDTFQAENYVVRKFWMGHYERQGGYRNKVILAVLSFKNGILDSIYWP